MLTSMPRAIPSYLVRSDTSRAVVQSMLGTQTAAAITANFPPPSLGTNRLHVDLSVLALPCKEPRHHAAYSEYLCI